MIFEIESSEARNAAQQREIDLVSKDLHSAQLQNLSQSDKINELRERSEAK